VLLQSSGTSFFTPPVDFVVDMHEKMLAKKAKISEEVILRPHYTPLSKIEGYERCPGVWRPAEIMIHGSGYISPITPRCRN
jgi:hypothetical protein